MRKLKKKLWKRNCCSLSHA